MQKTTHTTNAPVVIPKMKKRRQKVYPGLTKEQQNLVKEHRWIAGRLAHGAKCLTGGHTGSLTREDLESIANFALCVAATRYNPDLGIQFSTFAWKTARGYIQHQLRDYSRLVRTPRWVSSYKKAVDEGIKNNKTYFEIGEELGIGESKVLMVEMSSNNYHVSYDSSPDDWITREFISNDDDVRSYVLSPALVEAIKELSEAEINTLSKYVEEANISESDKEWASNKFAYLRNVAYGLIAE